MNLIEQQIYEFIEHLGSGEAELSDELIEEFGERAKAALRKHLSELQEEKFRLRISNIGRKLRHLMLEQKYGRGKPSPELTLKMLYGSLYEALTILLLKGSKVNLQEYDQPVTLKLNDAEIDGTLDVIIDGKVYDIKTASPYAYENKFDSYEALIQTDSFGYIDQGIGYAKARGIPFGGWIVINKSTGQLKVIDIPASVHDKIMQERLTELNVKINHIVNKKPIPLCDQAVEETYYRKPTGNVVLGDACKFCDHKDKCHPGIRYLASPISKSENPVYKWYIKLKEGPI